MSDLPVPAKLAGFALVLLASFGAAFGIGRAVGSDDDAPAPAPPAATTTSTTAPHHGDHS
jgi:hypothetical protein